MKNNARNFTLNQWLDCKKKIKWVAQVIIKIHTKQDSFVWIIYNSVVVWSGYINIIKFNKVTNLSHKYMCIVYRPILNDHRTWKKNTKMNLRRALAPNTCKTTDDFGILSGKKQLKTACTVRVKYCWFQKIKVKS